MTLTPSRVEPVRPTVAPTTPRSNDFARLRPASGVLRPRRSTGPPDTVPVCACYPSGAVLGGELAVPCSLQSAPAGPNPLSRSPFSVAACRCDVEDRVPRSGEPRTVSGPEGSSTKRSSPGAAERPGPSRPTWWARATDDRRRVHGIYDRRTGGGRDLDDTAPGAVSTLACPDVQPDRRPGSGRRDAPQRGPHRPRLARDPVRRSARHRQDVARADPREGRQLHGPAGRRSM